MLLRRHFRLEKPGQTAPAVLDKTGKAMDPNGPDMRWIRFAKEGDAERKAEYEKQLKALSREQSQIIQLLRAQQREDIIAGGNYVRIFKATDTCLICHHPDGSASPLSPNEAIGAVVILGSGGGIAWLINLVSVVVAGLIAGAGAIVAFYMITQRVILRPIRQLRALANNVAEGNLSIRSSIKTGDEYQKLADAFNHMLDGMQATQQKLRQANVQLDEKIAELSERNIELFRANKVKSEFLANISHEFRTPLNTILGFAQVLREKPGVLKKDKARRYTENIISSGNQLLNMISDLLDLAKTEAGKMDLHIAEAAVPDLCDAVIASFSAQTRKKKIKIKLIVDNDIPVLLTDAGKLQQILNNFVSNALKFTPQRGRIEIRATMRDEKTVRIAVSDTGCGVAEADKEKIFQKFQQADGSITRASAGSGLGLAISKELAVMLAGDIGVESELDKGSTFWLDIPIILTKEEDQND
jgi:signal transduction histidine kinase